MPSTKDQREFEAFLTGKPWVKRWVRQCIACGRRGLAPDAPDKFFSSWWVGRLSAMRQTEAGLCETCASAWEAAGNDA